MARKEPLAMSVIVDDWLTSPRISAMTTEQEGAYFRLLLNAWKDADLSVPADDASLASLSRLGKRWEKLKAPILACFEPHPTNPDRLINPKQWEQRQERLAYLAGASEAGKRGAAKRWGKDGVPHRQPKPLAQGTDGVPQQKPIRKSWGSDDSLSPIPSVTSDRTQKHAAVAAQTDPIGSPENVDDPDQDGHLTLTTEQQRIVNLLRDLTGETDHANLYRLIVRKLDRQAYLLVSALKQAIADQSNPVHTPGAVMVDLAKEIAARAGIVLFKPKVAA